jgi:hypothetical protein
MEEIGILVLVRELLSWRAILDISLIAAGLFFLYRTLIRLGTWKIVAGIDSFLSYPYQCQCRNRSYVV